MSYSGYAGASAASNPFLLELAGNSATLVEEKLNGADQEIDESFATGGYTTPIPVSSIASGVAKDRFTAKLAGASKAIAAYTLSAPAEGVGKKGSSERVKKDADDARAWLKQVATKAVVVAVLDETDGAVAAGSYTGCSVVGTAKWALTPELIDRANTATE